MCKEREFIATTNCYKKEFSEMLRSKILQLTSFDASGCMNRDPVKIVLKENIVP